MRPTRLLRLLRDALRSRRTRFTADSFRVADELEGRPLAGVLRRALAILLDLGFCVVLVIPLYMALLDHSIHEVNPGLPSIWNSEDESAPGSAGTRALNRALLQLAFVNTPENLPPALNYALSIGDSAAVDSLVESHRMVVMLAAGGEDEWRWREGRPIQLNALSLLGKKARTFSLFTVILVYFTLFTWLLRGRTPGKWLLGIRVLCLNGKPMGLWDSFGRAGGYSASVSTVFLGFLEAIRDSNRMALHDRIAGTVVVRTGGNQGSQPTSDPHTPDPADPDVPARADSSGV